MNCSNCGNKIDLDSKLCSKCGVVIQTEFAKYPDMAKGRLTFKKAVKESSSSGQQTIVPLIAKLVKMFSKLLIFIDYQRKNSLAMWGSLLARL